MADAVWMRASYRRDMGVRTSTSRRWTVVGAAAAIAVGTLTVAGLNTANADISSGDRPVFISITPCRLVDTRATSTVGPKSSPLGPAETYTVTAHGTNGDCTGASAIPTDAVGLSLNVTAIRPTTNTFLTFWGDGANPGTSNLNPRAGGAPTPNAVNTPLSGTGTFNVYNDRGDVDIAVDVNGYYAPHDHDDRYVRRDELAIDDFVFSGIVNADGLTFRQIGDVPSGATPTITPVFAGNYLIGLTGLSIDDFDPQVYLTPRNAIDRACTVNFVNSDPGDPVTSVAVAVRCTDLVGVPVSTEFSFLIIN